MIYIRNASAKLTKRHKTEPSMITLRVNECGRTNQPLDRIMVMKKSNVDVIAKIENEEGEKKR